jgi:predicted small lipoprotein YifL
MVKGNVTSTFLILILLLLAGCSSKPEVEIPPDIKQLENLTVISPGTQPAYSINFNQNAKFGGTDEVILGQIASVAVDDQGRIFIADRDQNIIHSYRPDGRYIRQIGNEGKGPGEFSSISLLRYQHDQLYAQDFRQRRVNVYQLDSL